MGARLAEASKISVSIIIPTLNEAEHLNQTLEALFKNINQSKVEIIITDGGSHDSTIAIAEAFPCQITSSESGRARQMNQARLLANGQWLLFLHADSSLPSNWLTEIESARTWGFFPVKLRGRHWFFRIIEFAMCRRSSITHVATGDQGLFFKKSFFDQLEGFPKFKLWKMSRSVKRPADYINRRSPAPRLGHRVDVGKKMASEKQYC